MKIAVTVTVCRQIGIDTWKDFHTTKVFDENTTIKDIEVWIKSIDDTSSLHMAQISQCVD